MSAPPPGVRVGTSAGYLRLAAFTMFLYDYALTLDDEIEYIWKARRSLAKVLFLLLRYVTFVVILIDTFFVIVSGMQDAYVALLITDSLMTKCHTTDVHVILQLRIYILFDRKRAMLYSNIALSIVELGVTAYILAHEFPKGKILTAPDWVIGSCYSWHPRSLAAGFAAPLAFETYLAALAFYNLRRGARLNVGATDIFSVLVRDSVIYFVFIAAVMALNVVLIALYQVLPGYASIGLVDAAGAIGGARLILSMLATTSHSDYNRHQAQFSTNASQATTATVFFEENTVRSRWRLTFLEALIPRRGEGTTVGTVSVRLQDV
ncbi:hypothetical protein AURDEDRAFT_173957 [Auricularia subglabra TFB-10046 SS5]|uniref:DUF6533 domain-containing protein n=1 Tax=Auricularia subglabra (strain TFB-10046 / SS5) TaxID=717982 RepID=J0CZH6_AURST|nr:hypothetical protein AURDEDRAFT_173957 [Auricularia subglabra TFB-10046 SS5]